MLVRSAYEEKAVLECPTHMPDLLRSPTVLDGHCRTCYRIGRGVYSKCEAKKVWVAK